MIQANTIVLTGATGFVGQAVLASLMRSTSARVVVLVRAPSERTAVSRLMAASGDRSLLAEGLCAERIEVCCLDLVAADASAIERAVRVGVGESELGGVIHCAAAVNGSMPADVIRAANVLATERMLEVGRALGAPRFCHVSTTAALGEQASVRAPDETTFPDPKRCSGGYAVTKAEAECVVTGACSRGASCVIARLGAVGGDSRTGWMNQYDHRWLVLRACVELGMHPVLPWSFRWAPVDFVAKALVAAVYDQQPPRVLHLVGKALAFMEVFSWLRRYGYCLSMVSAERWERELRNRASTAEPAQIVSAANMTNVSAAGQLSLLNQILPTANAPPIESARTEEWLARAGLRCPAIDREGVGSMLGSSVSLGYLPKVAEPPYVQLSRAMAARLRQAG